MTTAISSTMKKILIVDDLSYIRELLVGTLGQEHYQLHEAETGEDAVRIAEEEVPSVIIMDVAMPGKIDGVEATRIIKNNPKTKSCSILLLTAKTQSSDRKTGLDAGADGYIAKPFSPIQLIDRFCPKVS